MVSMDPVADESEDKVSLLDLNGELVKQRNTKGEEKDKGKRKRHNSDEERKAEKKERNKDEKAEMKKPIALSALSAG